MLTIESKQLHHSIQKTVHPDCVACSLLDQKGLHLEFEVSDEGVVSHFECDRSCQGYPGIMHGGIIATILDGAMGNCLFAQGRTAVTVEMTTRFRHPVYINRQATVRAWLVRPADPLYFMEAQIVQEGQIKATAKGKFYHQPQLAPDREQNND